MPITRLYTAGLLPTGPLSDCIPLFCYPHAHFQSVYYWSATNMLISTLYTTVLLPAGPLPDFILLFFYQHAHYHTEYYCSATNRPITRLYTTVLLPTDPLPDCILLFCYHQTHYQTVYYWSATNRPITRMYTSVLLPICPLPDCILLFCYQHGHYQTVYYCCETWPCLSGGSMYRSTAALSPQLSWHQSLYSPLTSNMDVPFQLGMSPHKTECLPFCWQGQSRIVHIAINTRLDLLLELSLLTE